MKLIDTSKTVRTSSFPKVLAMFLLLSWGLEGVRAADENPRVDDALATLTCLAAAPRPVRCDPGGFEVPAGGHLQGIQQATIAGAPFVILSGSSRAESYLALIALNDDPARVAAVKPLLPRPFKHAGGFQVCGDYLAVGIEDDNVKEVSKIWIVALPELLKSARPRPTVEIERRGAYKRATAGAVALAKVGGRHLLCVGTWDSATIDLYHSNGKALNDAACEFSFHETWDIRKADRSDWSDRDYASYQNLNFVVDANGRVFLVGFARTGGRDVADVFEFQAGGTVPVERRLRKVLRHVLRGQETSFRHGAGLAVIDANSVNVLACGYQKFVLERFGPSRR